MKLNGGTQNNWILHTRTFRNGCGAPWRNYLDIYFIMFNEGVVTNS